MSGRRRRWFSSRWTAGGGGAIERRRNRRRGGIGLPKGRFEQVLTSQGPIVIFHHVVDATGVDKRRARHSVATGIQAHAILQAVSGVEARLATLQKRAARLMRTDLARQISIVVFHGKLLTRGVEKRRVHHPIALGILAGTIQQAGSGVDAQCARVQK